MGDMTKAQKLAEAAKLRHKTEEANAAVAPQGSVAAKVDEEAKAGKREVFGRRLSARTAEEQRRGKEALNRREAEKPSKRASTTRTVVTDASTDPDGTEGKAKAEKAAAEASSK